MLVLSRHRDEVIMIGDEVVITVVDIRGDKARLGIDAPQDLPVHRKEVYDAIKREGCEIKSLSKSESLITAGDGYEFCNDFIADQWFDFNDALWKPMDRSSVAPHNCCLYRRRVK